MLKRLLAAGAALVALAGCSPSGETPPPSTATVPGTPTPAPRQLAVGECTGPLGPTVSGTEAIKPVDCADEHSFEVFAIVHLLGETLPAPDTLRVIANNRCLPAFVDFVGVEPGYSRYASIFLAPDEASWQVPELRRITCLLGSGAGGLEGSGRDDTTLFPAVGQCTGPQDVPVLEIELVSCKKEHHYEVYAEKVIDADKAPTGKTLAKLINSVCVAAFKKFVGVDSSMSRYEFAYLIADAGLWDKVGDHRLVCSAGSPRGGIEGSLEGKKA